MIYYVAHAYSGDKDNIEKAKKITHDLQVKDLANCYICPLMAFSYLDDGEVQKSDAMELCFDILQNCEKLIVASEVSEGVQMEIDFAKLIGLEIKYLD